MINTTTTCPITLTGSFDYYNNIPYDKYNRTTIDLFIPTSGDGPYSVVMHHHGGGFIVGADDPTGYDSDLKAFIEACIANNIAFAYTNYRLMSRDGERETLLKSLECGPKSLQFLIDNSAAYNLDPDKICLRGMSAGNGLLMHSLHHTAIEVDCMVFQSPQATYDLKYEVIPSAQWDIETEIATYPYSRKYLLRGAGVKNFANLTGAEWTAFTDEAHYVGMSVTGALTEAYIETKNDPSDLADNPTNVAHHFNHCLLIQTKLEAEGVTCTMNLTTATPTPILATETMTEFVVRRLGSVNYGSELVSNHDFTSSGSWAYEGGLGGNQFSIVDRTLVYSGHSTSKEISQSLTLLSSKTYTCFYKISDVEAGKKAKLRIDAKNTPQFLVLTEHDAGEYEFTFSPPSDTTSIRMNTSLVGDGGGFSLHYLSIKEII